MKLFISAFISCLSLFALAQKTQTTVVKMGEVMIDEKDRTQHNIHFRIYDIDANLTSATATVNGKSPQSTDADGNLYLRDLKMGDRIRIYKQGYDTSYCWIMEETLFGQVIDLQLRNHQDSRAFSAPWSNVQEFEDVPESPEESSHTTTSQPEEIYAVVDQPAEFPGGMTMLKTYLIQNLHYPQTAIDKGIEGKLFVELIVTEKGEVQSAQVKKGLSGCPECDGEALRLVKQIPAFTPAMQGGKPVKSRLILPIVFKMQL